MSKVLIIIDMQNDFINGSLGTKEAQEIVPNVINEIKKCKNDGYILYATKDTHFSHGEKFLAYEDSLEGQKLPVPHCIIGTKGWELHPDIFPLLEDAIIINKPTFGSYELINWLKEEDKISELVEIKIIGLCTDICVVSNALMVRAAFKDVPVIVKENCCAGVTPDTHKAAIETMKMCQIDIE